MLNTIQPKLLDQLKAIHWTFYMLFYLLTHRLINEKAVQSQGNCVMQHVFPSPKDWRKPPGRPQTTWMKTIQQDPRSNNLSLDEAITVAQNRPLWRLMSAFGATHP